MAGTPTETDNRRARQRSSQVVRELRQEIQTWMEDEGIQIWNTSTGSPRERARQMNEIITRMSSEKFRRELLPSLEEQREITMRRAANASSENIRQALQGQVDESDLIGPVGQLSQRDHRLNSVMSQIDAGVLYEDGDSIAEQVGDRISRQLRIGFAEGEPVRSTDPDATDLTSRVQRVMNNSDLDIAGDSGMTIQSRAELISHDSIQDAHTSAAHQRYLNNGFRYARYDAVVDNKTSEVCSRMNGTIIDLKDNPGMKPPNHPWCRSDIIPLLEPDGEAISEEEIGDEHLDQIWGTNSFRPTAIDTEAEYNPTVLNDLINQAEANRASSLG